MYLEHCKPEHCRLEYCIIDKIGFFVFESVQHREGISIFKLGVGYLLSPTFILLFISKVYFLIKKMKDNDDILYDVF